MKTTEGKNDQPKSSDKFSIMNSIKKYISPKTVLILVFLICIIGFLVYNIFIVHTVDSHNGYKHQVGSFGRCLMDEYDGCGNGTHRIVYFGGSTNFCDYHWELSGSEMYWSLVGMKSDSDRSTDAKVCAQKAVEDNLKTPSTAKFCSYNEMKTENLGGDTWKISGYVDAQNSFGTFLQKNWTVTLTLTDTGFKDATVIFDN